MWPVVRQLLDALRRDDHDPIHALDPWLLREVGQTSRTAAELAASDEVRRGPHGDGPELDAEQVRRWVRDAVDRGLIEPDDGGSGPLSITPDGKSRLGSLRGLRMGLGNALAAVVGQPSVWKEALKHLAEEGGVRVGPPPPRRPDLPTISRSPGDAEIGEKEATANLERVKHIVVLMMENRSFDHMLGYLETIDGQSEVEGPGGAPPITYKAVEHRPEYLLNTRFPKAMDPPHGGDEVHLQIHGGAMDGFLESFDRVNDPPYPERIMGYYSYRELPVYDYFAYSFTLCDRWFSSVPASTWPNRLYSLTGTCDPEREGLFGGGGVLFDFKSFVRLLENEDSPDTWRWYSWDPGTLRLADGRYRNPEHGFHHEHFRRVAQHSIAPEPSGEGDDFRFDLGSGLLEDAANGDLASVSWVDPNFVDLSILDASSNDDHPPSDVRAGQEHAMLVFRALAESPCWKDTMLIVTYDEHGGFYDHCAPPAPPEDHPQYETYGVRVPAFVVSPFVEPRTVSHTPFDHTSIIRTILERFGVEGAVDELAKQSPRVAEAEHLGRLLTRDPKGDAATAPPYAEVNEALDEWRTERAKRRSAASGEIATRSASDETWEPGEVTGFPAEFLGGARELRRGKRGLPAGHP